MSTLHCASRFAVTLAVVTAFARGAQDEAGSAGDKGLPVSAAAPSILPLHLTGPHAGKTACPLCVYGTAPHLQIWVQEEHLSAGLRLAQRAEALCAAGPALPQGHTALVAYLLLVPKSAGAVTAATIDAVRSAGLEHVFSVQVRSWDDADTSGLYGHSERDRPRVRVYSLVNRRVFQRWDDPAPGRWADIAKAVADSSQFVVAHEIADAQIAPPWEPGERLEIEFQVVDAKDRPIPGTKVSALQADADGLYNPAGWNRRTPRLAALAWTDGDGMVTFRTIRPGAYPSKTEPAHIHFSVVIDGKPQFRTLWFEGDPLLTPARREWAEQDEETVIVPLDAKARPHRARHRFVVRG